jgi:hypothetical protein
VRTALRSVLASRTELEAFEERRQAQRSGCAAVKDLQDRCEAELSGVLRSVILRPRQNVPALEAELFDGTGSVSIVWLGRRRIAGVEPGRRMRLLGRVSMSDGRAVVYNPRYELVPREGE